MARLFSVAFGLQPITLWTIQHWQDNRRAAAARDSVTLAAEEVLGKSATLSDADMELAARRIQDRLFRLRVESPLVPNWFYAYWRDDDEAQMTESAARIAAKQAR